eukprot:2526244-Ditylum_brightwellii.AAC.1
MATPCQSSAPLSLSLPPLSKVPLRKAHSEKMGRIKRSTQQEKQIGRRQRKKDEMDMEHDYLKELMEKGTN